MSKNPNYTITPINGKPKPDLCFCGIDKNVLIFTSIKRKTAIRVKYENNTFSLNKTPCQISNSSNSKVLGIRHFQARAKAMSGGAPTQFYDLEFDHFPFSIGYIKIPTNTYIYRAGNSDAANTPHPRFFASYEYASFYKDERNTLYAHTPKHTLHLLDIRLLKGMMMSKLLDLRDFLINNPSSNSKTIPEHLKVKYCSKLPQKYIQSVDTNLPDLGIKDITDLDTLIFCMKMLGLAFGLTSIQNQLAILKEVKDKEVKNATSQNLPEPFENFGDRWSEGDIDDYVIQTLKANFSPICNGYIGPKMKLSIVKCSFHSELCLFSPNLVLNTQIINGSKQNGPLSKKQKTTPRPKLEVSSIIRGKPYIGSYYNHVYNGGAPPQTLTDVSPIIETLDEQSYLYYCDSVEPPHTSTWPRTFYLNQNSCNKDKTHIYRQNIPLYLIDISIMRFVALEVLMELYRNDSLSDLNISKCDIKDFLVSNGLVPLLQQLKKPFPYTLPPSTDMYGYIKQQSIHDSDKLLKILFGHGKIHGYIDKRQDDYSICLFNPKKANLHLEEPPKTLGGGQKL